MADWLEPNNDAPAHTDVLQTLIDKDTHSATMGQSGTFTNRPEGFMIWDNVSRLFKRLTSGVETIVKLSIAGGGTGGSTAAEARANLGANEAGTGAAQTRTNAENGTIYTPLTRNISTSGALNGGGSLDGDLSLSIADSSTATKGAVQLDNTLTSTATDKALTAAQGKALKDEINAIPIGTVDVGFYQADNLGPSGDLASGGCKVVRVGDVVVISGYFSHASGTFMESAVNYLPDWASTASGVQNNVRNTYIASATNLFSVIVSERRLVFNYDSSITTTLQFTISYTV